MSTLQIIQIDASEMDNFSYLIFCPETLQGAAVDPSLWPDKLIKKAEQRKKHGELDDYYVKKITIKF